MRKKSLIIVSVLLAILFISTASFANNDLKNGIHNATDTVVDGAENLAEDVRSGIGTAENVIEDGARNIGTAISDGVNDVAGAANSGYTATRTTASDITNSNTMNSSLWTWVSLAIAAVVIVGLVWYYGTQHNDTER